MLGLLWEDFLKNVKPVDKVEEIRKNILVYKLQTEPNNTFIQNVQNIWHLQGEKHWLNKKIKDIETKRKNKKSFCIQKGKLF